MMMYDLLSEGVVGLKCRSKKIQQWANFQVSHGLSYWRGLVTEMEAAQDLEETISTHHLRKERYVCGDICGPVVLKRWYPDHAHVQDQTNESLHLCNVYILPVSKSGARSKGLLLITQKIGIYVCLLYNQLKDLFWEEWGEIILGGFEVTILHKVRTRDKLVWDCGGRFYCAYFILQVLCFTSLSLSASLSPTCSCRSRCASLSPACSCRSSWRWWRWRWLLYPVTLTLIWFLGFPTTLPKLYLRLIPLTVISKALNIR